MKVYSPVLNSRPQPLQLIQGDSFVLLLFDVSGTTKPSPQLSFPVTRRLTLSLYPVRVQSLSGHSSSLASDPIHLSGILLLTHYSDQHHLPYTHTHTHTGQSQATGPSESNTMYLSMDVTSQRGLHSNSPALPRTHTFYAKAPLVPFPLS
jgi:hypothetical protein